MLAPDQRPLHVLHVVETLDVGGAESVVASIANLSSDSVVPVICCLVKSGAIAARLRAGIEVIELGKRERGNDFLVPFRLARLIRERNIDIVHSHDWGTLLESASAAMLSGICAVHMAHGPIGHYEAEDKWVFIKRRLRRVAERACSWKLYKAIAVSERIYTELLEVVGIPRKKLALIRNGVNVERFQRFPSSVIRDETGWRADDVVVLAVGRLAAIKNQLLLLRAAAILISRGLRVKVAIVGDGPERERLQAGATDLGIAQHVRLFGERDNVRDYLVAADIYVLPSFYEGISISLLEAMAAGLPVVATRVGGNCEVVLEEETGLLVESDCAEQLSDALATLVADGRLREAMGNAGAMRVKAEFDVNKAVAACESIYMQALKKAVG